MLTLSAVAILGGAWWLGAADRSPVITTTVVLAALAFLLFRLAEDDLSPGMKAIARRWMMPVEGKVRVSAIEAFNGMFEAVFGRRHFSWFCFWRSALASIAFFLVFAVVLDRMYFQEALMRYTLVGSENAGTAYLVGRVAGLAILGVVLNVAGDYLSLLETRALLRAASRFPALLAIFVVLDAILTGVIFMAPFVAIGTMAGWDLNRSLAQTFDIIAQRASNEFYQGWKEGGVFTIVYASLATAYLTSIWLWLALVFTPIVRLAVWSRTKGLTAIGRTLDAERRPMVALGYVTALLILACGGILWGVGFAWTALVN